MAKIVIDAGHGGNDPGASGNGMIEKEYALKISEYIYNRLRQLGLDVKMTRTTDETLSPTERVNRVLNAFGDSSDVIVISNHINAGGVTYLNWWVNKNNIKYKYKCFIRTIFIYLSLSL